MARGRQQKWVCLDCKQEFSVQATRPKMCCSCGSCNLVRAFSYELAAEFGKKKAELAEIAPEFNKLYSDFRDIKERRDAIMVYWQKQKSRGYITKEEYDEIASAFADYANRKESE